MKYGKSPKKNTTPSTSRRKAELRLAPAAERDLINIALYGMEQFGIEQSEQYRDKLKQRFLELTEAPLMYPAVDNIREGYRRSVCGGPIKTISFTEARENLNNVLDQVVNGAEPIVINGSGGGDVVVMSHHAYNSLMETVHLLRSANNSAHLVRSIAQYSECQVTC